MPEIRVSGIGGEVFGGTGRRGSIGGVKSALTSNVESFGGGGFAPGFDVGLEPGVGGGIFATA